MTGTQPDAGATPPPEISGVRLGQEQDLVVRVLTTVLREDIGGIRTGGTLVHAPDLDAGPWLRALHGGQQLLVPVRSGGFLADFTVRRAAVVVHRDGRHAWCERLEDVLDALRPHDDPEAAAGFADFTAECRAALAAREVRDRYAPAVRARLGTLLDAGPVTGTGAQGAVVYDTLATTLGHPLYPTAEARPGLSPADLARYAPECRPTFPLRWLLLPRTALTLAGHLPEWWPTPGHLGSADRPDHVAMPVHPLTAAGPLPGALDEDGLSDQAVLVGDPYLDVVPTLSMRTVAVRAHPGVHLKLPLPTSTLGRRNRRSIKPATLHDGAVAHDLLGQVLAREASLHERILLTDEGTYGHTGHEWCAFLVRRHPPALRGACVVSVAALLAAQTDGALVIDALADAFFGGDTTALLDAYLTLLFALHTRLWLRYGIVLEAHQQNTAIVLDAHDGHTRLRLLLKDDDGARVDPTILRAALDADPPVFADPRTHTTDPGELADVYTTITVQLTAAALAAGLASRRGDPPVGLLALVRRRLEDSLAGHEGARDLPLLRDRVLDAERVPVKTMVTAATLLPKARTGAADVNKHYGATAPNPLAPTLVAGHAG